MVRAPHSDSPGTYGVDATAMSLIRHGCHIHVVWGLVRTGVSAPEEAVADADACLAVVQGAEPGREALVGVAVGGGDGVDVPDGLDHLGRVGEQRAGGLRLEVEVEAAQAVAVFGQVIDE